MKIKICGITNLEDARLAIEAGADMLGFNFYPQSPRYVSLETCAAILSEVTRQKSSMIGVGVFVNSTSETVLSVLDHTGLQLAQLSGDEPTTTLASLGRSAFKVVRLSQGSSPNETELIQYASLRADHLPAVLLDADVKGAYGGTGMTTDWVAAARLARQTPLLLAGGLTPENIRKAVHQVFPWGVDVASGVESSPGKKDANKVRRFIQNARDAFRDGVRVEAALEPDLPEILVLQKLAYQSEAELNQDFNIPPLTQTLSQLQEEYGQALILNATVDGQIVGSVRGALREGTCHIGRLIVHPGWQNCGIGSRLMAAIEGQFTAARRFELFTSQRSVRNLYLYRKLGYEDFRQEPLSEKVTLIYLGKRNSIHESA